MAAPVYQVNLTNVQKPQMSLSDAYEGVRHGLQRRYYGAYGFANEDIQVTSEGFSFKYKGIKSSARYSEVQNLTVIDDPNTKQGNLYILTWGSLQFFWQNQNEAQGFVDAVAAMKYYSSNQSLEDDKAAFADFQDKVKVWQALSQKPLLPEEARRFRVLADAAVQDKDFDKAANDYEQGLAIDPMWPAGQYNAAIIYGELKVYPMAVMHMKRYLALKPDAQDAKADQDKVYVWEDKANENK